MVVLTRRQRFVAAIVALAIAGCSGGGTPATGGGSLNIQVGSGAGTSEGTVSCNHFDQYDSAAIQTLQVALRSSTEGFSCCLAFDPCDKFFDSNRRIVLALPDPPAAGAVVDVTLAAFADRQAPSLAGAGAQKCLTSPRGIGVPCDPPRCDAFPSFLGSADEVQLIAHRQTDVTISAMPRLVLRNLNPGCAEPFAVP